jgi:hypothetical protein
LIDVYVAVFDEPVVITSMTDAGWMVMFNPGYESLAVLNEYSKWYPVAKALS